MITPFFDMIESPIGKIFPIFMGKNLIGLRFDKPDHKKGQAPEAFKRELLGYFEGRTKEFTVSAIFLNGTEFERQVWMTLREVSFGETRSYGWLAEKIGAPRAQRAVGRALGKNPIPIIYPCHRIIESAGSIGGYSSGIDNKRRLLALEFYNAVERK